MRLALANERPSFPASRTFAEDDRANDAHVRVYRWLFKNLALGEIRYCKGEWVGLGAKMQRQRAVATLRQLIAWGYCLEHPPLPEDVARNLRIPIRLELAYDLKTGHERPSAADPAIYSDDRVTKRTRRIYEFLCPRLLFNAPTEFPTWWIAERAGFHRPDVQKALSFLVRLGYLVEHPRTHSQGRLFSLPIQQLHIAA